MPLIAYEQNTMRGQTLAIAEQAAAIAREYNAAGYDLTLRQLYYQFVARGLTADWPTGVNTERSYKRLGSIVDKARMCGIIDWYHITDRTRATYAGQSHFDSPSDLITGAAASYHVDKWEGQPNRCELWVEKEALAGILSQVAEARDVNYMACRGYMSSSAMWRAARRIGWQLRSGLYVTVYHLGDHDPSGIDMTRDNEQRLLTMIGHDFGYSAASRLTFDRIALTREQVDEYDPPPNPAKLTDSRSGGYLEEHGDESWELDALPPDVLVDLLNSKIDDVIDQDAWNARLAEENADRARLSVAAANWLDVAEWVDDTYGSPNGHDDEDDEV
jgi:hypothetical protein